MSFFRVISWVGTRWDHFWFQKTTPLDLGVTRFFFFSYLLVTTWEMNWKPSVLPPSFWDPILVFQLIGLSAPTKMQVFYLGWACKVSWLFSALGMFTRFSTLLSLVLSFFLFGILNSYGTIRHDQSIALLCLVVFAFSRCADGFSWECFQTKIRYAAHGRYHWPLQVGRFLLVVMFFLSALSKLRDSGWEWVISDNLRNIFLIQWHERRDLPALTHWLTQFPSLCRAMAFYALGIELLAPVTLLSRRLSPFIVAGLFSLQAANALLLGIHGFSPNWAVYFFWICWTKVFSALSLRTQNASQPRKIAQLIAGLSANSDRVTRNGLN